MNDITKNISDDDAKILLNTFNHGGFITDQGEKINGISRGKGMISINGDICIIRYENGDVVKHKHPFFYKNNKKLISLPRIESKAPGKNSIEWELPDEAKFVYMIIKELGHTTIITIKKDAGKTNPEFISEMIHESDAMTAIAKGVDFLEQYGYTLDNSTLSFAEKMNLGLYSRNDLKSDVMFDGI
ncbi:MAG: hypothetical protein WA057_02370 [Candidatus Magasanikiibacteriota bacterium]